jgi:cation diffusion facilitator CzcD-associated flavoprotein CzcO
MGSLIRPAGPFSVKRIGVIGAGPSGLAAAKFFLAENAFDQIDVFEQQPEVGGVWFYHRNIVGHINVPQITPHDPPELLIWPKGAAASLFSNPMYDKLNTNIPKELMQFSDQAFLSKSLLYPTREDVQNYLVDYSQDVRHLIKFSTQVEDIRLSLRGGQHRWELTSKSTITDESRKSEYDAILVASGHYSVPYIPSVPGIEAFDSAYPSIITHSKVRVSSEENLPFSISQAVAHLS